MHVLGTGFFAVMAVTKGLPVAPVPEQKRIAFMRFDVIDIRRLHKFALPQALFTQGMRLQELSSGLLPRTSIATAGGGAHLFRV